jgi:hypothetical protein
VERNVDNHHPGRLAFRDHAPHRAAGILRVVRASSSISRASGLASAASTAAASTASAASPGTASAASPGTASAASPPGKFFADFRCSGVLLVEDIECRQADVRDFLLTESDFVTRCGVPRRYVRCWPTGSRRCAARKSQRHPSDSQHRYGFPRTLSLRGVLRMRHSRVPSSKYP